MKAIVDTILRTMSAETAVLGAEDEAMVALTSMAFILSRASSSSGWETSIASGSTPLLMSELMLTRRVWKSTSMGGWRGVLLLLAFALGLLLVVVASKGSSVVTLSVAAGIAVLAFIPFAPRRAIGRGGMALTLPLTLQAFRGTLCMGMCRVPIA